MRDETWATREPHPPPVEHPSARSQSIAPIYPARCQWVQQPREKPPKNYLKSSESMSTLDASRTLTHFKSRKGKKSSLTCTCRADGDNVQRISTNHNNLHLCNSLAVESGTFLTTSVKRTVTSQPSSGFKTEKRQTVQHSATIFCRGTHAALHICSSISTCERITWTSLPEGQQTQNIAIPWVTWGSKHIKYIKHAVHDCSCTTQWVYTLRGF